MTSAAALKKQPVPFGKYLLLDRVNIGGMAEVWRGKRFGLGGFEQLVAIKRILPNIAEDAEFIGMFIDEAKITAQLAHANIARVYELGNVNQSYFIAMEYIPGRDLRALFDRARKRGDPIPVGLACYIIARVCEGLDYAHRRKDGQGREMGIVHRDVSPQNVLISYEGEVKLIDFGIVKAANKASQTQAGILKGKFGYMSPEQIRGFSIDRRSDIFAAGVCLYELLTGERLFVGESDYAVLEKVRRADVPPPSHWNPQVPEALDRIVLRALARNVEERYDYANELAEELQRFILSSAERTTRKELSQLMQAMFAEEVQREKLRLQECADIKAPESMLAALEQANAAPRQAHDTGPVALTETDYRLRMAEADSDGPTLGADAPTPSVPLVTMGELRPRLSPVLEAAPKLANGVVASVGSDAGPTAVTDGSANDSGTHTIVPPGQLDITRNDNLESQVDSAPGRKPSQAVVPTVTLRPDPPRPNVDGPVSVESRPRLTPVRPEVRSSPTSQRWLPRRGSPQMRVLATLAALVVVLFLVTLYLLVRKPSTGYVYLELPGGTPGVARVNINGEDLGEQRSWPLVHKTVSGNALIVVTVPGYEPFRTTANVREGAETTQVEVKLTAAARLQRVLVLTSPDEAKVRVNGQWVKEDPTQGPALVELAVGATVELEVVAPGYRAHREQLLVRGNAKTQVVNVRLDPENVELTVTSEPSGATVVVNGRESGTTPATVHVRGPSAEVVLRKRCYVPTRLAVKLGGTATESVSGTLKRSAACRER